MGRKKQLYQKKFGLKTQKSLISLFVFFLKIHISILVTIEIFILGFAPYDVVPVEPSDVDKGRAAIKFLFWAICDYQNRHNQSHNLKNNSLTLNYFFFVKKGSLTTRAIAMILMLAFESQKIEHAIAKRWKILCLQKVAILAFNCLFFDSRFTQDFVVRLL